jgi:F-box protein 18 (helicase)
LEIIRKFSDNQNEVITSRNQPITVVTAFAGCGKSTMLVGYAKHRHKMRGLYLCYNRSVAIEARLIFPPAHTEVMTMHGLAHRAVMNKAMGERLESTIQPLQVIQFIDEGEGVIQKSVLAIHALSTVEAFCNSGASKIGMDHLPLDSLYGSGLDPEIMLHLAETLFMNMMKSSSCPITHSFYLKIYQLSEPDLSENFDYIMVDEAQDLNPVVLAILDKQDIPIIRVGDVHQSINEFRGTVNALEDGYDQKFVLNESYRFGENHAALASRLLTSYKDVEDVLIGKGKVPGDIQTADSMNAIANKGLEIYRTNGRLFQRAVDYLFPDGEIDVKQKRSIFFVGGAKSYRFDNLISAYKLFKTGEGWGGFAGYDNWKQYCAIAEQSASHEMMATQGTVERYKGSLPVFVSGIYDGEVRKREKADFMLSNAHKSKGLEADYVVLGKDFPDLSDEDNYGVKGEVNLAYVAMTRAKKSLGLPPKMLKMLGLEADEETGEVVVPLS